MAGVRPWYYFKQCRQEAAKFQDALEDPALPEAPPEQQEEAPEPVLEEYPNPGPVELSLEVLKMLQAQEKSQHDLEYRLNDVTRRLQDLERLFNQMDANIRTLDVQATLSPRYLRSRYG